MKPYNQSDSKAEQVREMFDTIAPNYDRLNHLLSFGVDRLWRGKMVRMVSKSMATPQRTPAHYASRNIGKKRNKRVDVIDLATGTADLAIAMARKMENAHIVGVDPSEGMLKVAEKKIQERKLSDRIELSLSAAEEMPFKDAQFNALTIGFGIRNFQDMDASLREMLRVLKSGGKLYILEFSIPENRVLASLYRVYFHRVLPVIGGWISKDKEAYRYLPLSVEEFLAPEMFRELLSETGFVRCRSRSLTFGIARIYTAEKL